MWFCWRKFGVTPLTLAPRVHEHGMSGRRKRSSVPFTTFVPIYKTSSHYRRDRRKNQNAQLQRNGRRSLGLDHKASDLVCLQLIEMNDHFRLDFLPLCGFYPT